jgi:thymidylate kinase
MTTQPRDGLALFRLRQEVRRRLRLRQRYDRRQAVWVYFRELWRRSRWAARISGERKFRKPERGATIALVGIDGSGKTTLSRDVAAWLAEKMDVTLYYMGSKQPSLWSSLLYKLFRMARRSQREVSKIAGDDNPLAGLLARARQALLYGHYLSVGYDRYRRYRRSLKKVHAGAIVVFDRFPFESPLDGPEVRRAAEQDCSRAAAFFTRWEQNLYSKFALPDRVIVLDVQPEISQQRKPDHPRETIEAKYRAVQALAEGHREDFVSRHWFHVNADQPYVEVLQQVQTAVWEALA